MSPKNCFAFLLGLLCVWEIGIAQDYLRLKNGQIVPGAIVRTDSTTVFLADWEDRYQPLPRLQVFTKKEIESVWFARPPQTEQRTLYQPHERGYEFGGGLSFQSLRDGDYSRRMLHVSLLGGYTIFPMIGIETEGDFTFPFGDKKDSTWHDYKNAYHVAINILVHPVTVRGFAPFALIGGGTASAIPLGRTIVTTDNDQRNLLNFGVGFKFGQGGIGCRIEYRYMLYEWNPDESVNEVRVEPREAFCHLVRAGLFFYR
jgi:hypothetical protein